MSTAAAATSTPASPKSWSILGKNLKANSAADLEPYLSELKAMDDVEEVHLGGNSLGVEACVALAEVFGSKKGLKVSLEFWEVGGGRWFGSGSWRANCCGGRFEGGEIRDGEEGSWMRGEENGEGGELGGRGKVFSILVLTGLNDVGRMGECGFVEEGIDEYVRASVWGW